MAPQKPPDASNSCMKYAPERPHPTWDSSLLQPHQLPSLEQEISPSRLCWHLLFTEQLDTSPQDVTQVWSAPRAFPSGRQGLWQALLFHPSKRIHKLLLGQLDQGIAKTGLGPRRTAPNPAEVPAMFLPTDGEGHGNPLQYSYLENPMDGGAWQAAVHGVPKNQTRLSD